MSLPFMRKLNPFKPTDIAGCQLWLDSTDSSTVSFSSGSNVSQWRDKSGSSNHFSITNGTTSYISDNGMSVISFPSGAIMSSANQITFTTSSAFYIVSRINSITGAGIGMLLGFTNINGADKSIRLYVSGTIGISLLGTAGVGDGNELANNNYFVNGSFNPSFGSNAYLNVYSIIGTVAPQSGGTSFLTLSSSFMSRFFIGNIAEFIYYPAGITNRQREQIEGYLAQKWGLQANLPAGSPGRTGVIYPHTLLIDSLTTGQPTQKPFIRSRATLYTSIFTYTGALQNFLVPATTSSITVYMWGAGGGGYFPTQSYGGAGCYLTGTLPVTGGETLSVLVGQAGTIQFPAQTGLATRFGGGGGIISTGGNANAQYNGSGGGRSAIQRSSVDIVSAGAGGGCGTQAGSGNGHNGGTGSWTGTGGNGADDKFGLGGTQTAGGASQGNGLGGTALVGGRADPWGGGGGGGFYGGGAGSDNGSFGSGGGGGSSYTGLLSNASGSNGTLNVAPATNSPYYVSGVAVGGTQALSGNGGPGLVVITYFT
jgi:hypothetical protein